MNPDECGDAARRLPAADLQEVVRIELGGLEHLGGVAARVVTKEEKGERG